jgi:F-type H+-transporting ATPase subunit gamma
MALLIRRAPATFSRGFASEKQLKNRIKAVKNIQKITKAVYMVASAKLRRAEQNLNSVRAYSKSMNELWPIPATSNINPQSNYLLAVVSGDRGLCGSFNSTVTREARRRLNAVAGQTKSTQVITFGEKIRVGLLRNFGSLFAISLMDLWRSKIPSFKQTALLSDVLSKASFDEGHLVYNSFKNLMSFETKEAQLRPLSYFEKDKFNTIVKYEIEGGMDFMDNLYEFRNAVLLWSVLTESATAELSSRMNAMQGASKNTKEMINSLSLKYNRSRQARITTELTEIVSGASAMDEGAS